MKYKIQVEEFTPSVSYIARAFQMVLWVIPVYVECAFGQSSEEAVQKLTEALKQEKEKPKPTWHDLEI